MVLVASPSGLWSNKESLPEFTYLFFLPLCLVPVLQTGVASYADFYVVGPVVSVWKLGKVEWVQKP